MKTIDVFNDSDLNLFHWAFLVMNHFGVDDILAPNRHRAIYMNKFWPSILAHAVHPTKYPPQSSRFVAFCCGVISDNFTHIFQGYFTGIVTKRFPQCHWSNPDEYGWTGYIEPLWTGYKSTTQQSTTNRVHIYRVCIIMMRRAAPGAVMIIIIFHQSYNIHVHDRLTNKKYFHYCRICCFHSVKPENSG